MSVQIVSDGKLYLRLVKKQDALQIEIEHMQKEKAAIVDKWGGEVFGKVLDDLKAKTPKGE
jgi:hypothetical protein